MQITLNSDQQKAIKELTTWFYSSKRFIILEGAAGTGKTFLVKHFINEIKCEPLFTAPSNEACRQLEEAIGSDVNIMTTYAALGFHFDTTKETEELVTKGEHSIINDIDIILVDECFHPDVELLTDQGFIKISELKRDEKIASMDLETGLVTFDVPLHYLEKDYSGEMCKLVTDRAISFNTTINHDQVVIRENIRKKVKIREIDSYSKFILTAPSGMSGKSLDAWDRLAIAFQADGSYNLYTKGATRHTNKYVKDGYSEETTSIQFSLVKERKKERLENILESLQLPYTKTENSSGKTIYRINKIPANRVSKSLKDIFSLEVSSKFAKEFIEEVINWDGHVTVRDSLYYSSIVEDNVNLVQAMAVLGGFKTNKTVQIDTRKSSYKPVHRLFINENVESGVFSNFKKKIEYYNYKGKVYCVTMPNGNVVIRYNGQVSVSGNCSMVNEKLLTALRDTDRKVLFIGHRSQLPAVEQNLSTFDLCESIVFKQGFQTVTLTKPERNTGELFEFINSLEKIIYEQPRLFSKQYNIPTKEVDINIYRPETREKLFEEQKKIICYSNNEVDKYNERIRQAIFKTKHLADFEIKDRILLTKPVNFITRLNGLRDSTVVNKEVNVKLSANTKAMITKVDLCSIFDVPCYDLSVVVGGQKLQLYIPTDTRHFNNYRQKLLHDAYGMRTPKAKENAFRKYHFIMSLFANVKHSYAITTHRSQGMTIPEVVVNWGDIKKCGNIILKHKLLYVAASRSRDNLRIF